MKKELEKQIIGVGEVKGTTFNQIFDSQYAYIYEANDKDGKISHYEVFERKTSAVCIDFENKVYSETEFKERYPKSNAFGIWAWTSDRLCKAMERFKGINLRLELKEKNNI